MERGLRRIAIVNRGEPAMRLINAVSELRHELRTDMRTIALHTRAERTAMFVREADEAVCLDDVRSPDAASLYLDLPTLERALLAAEADAAWVGWGFVAERPEFAELCARLGVVFVGPPPDVMRRLGDKIGAKRLAEEANVPVAPWSAGPVDSLDEARQHAAKIGYPLMIKASAGGGGRGIRRVDDEEGLAEAFASARTEGLKAFGDETVFMERVLTGARHVEVQLIADTHGTVWAAGVRDCSLQRRNQKVIEESQCVAMTPEQDRDLRAAAVRLAQLAGYENAGTVEFLYQPDEQLFAFLEVNTRLQVEHPVTELTTGLDLVKLQLHVAAGGHLEGDPPPTTGYAIEARLNGEDPQRAFAPAPGTIDKLVLPVGPGIRVDTGVAAGDVIPPEYDSMIAKIIAQGRDRDEALARLRRALSQTTVIVQGGTTNKSFLLELLDRAEVRAGDYDTTWLDRLTAANEHVSTRYADVALVTAALHAGFNAAEAERATFLSWASRGRPEAEATIGREIELRHGGQSYRLTVRPIGSGRFHIDLDGVTTVVEGERMSPVRARLTIGGRTFHVVSSTHGSEHLVEVDGVAHRFSLDDAGIVRTPAAALVVRVDVAPDDVVEAGARVAVVEAMKMEIGIAAPVGGRVRDVFVVRNMQVDAGAPLLRIEPLGEQPADEVVADRISLEALHAEHPQDALELVRACVLGYDIEPSTARRALAHADRSDPRVIGILEAFADLCAVAPERRLPDVDTDDSAGTREYFNHYLRSLDAEGEGLPEWFVERLRRALAHYGVADLDRDAELEDALMRIFIAQLRRDDVMPIVTSVLEGELPESGLWDALERLIDATQRRYPAIASLSRAVRYSRFDRPHIERTRAEVSAAMRRLSCGLTADSPADQVELLVSCPLPLVPILAETNQLADTDSPGALLTVLTRRYYVIRALEQPQIVPSAARSCASPGTCTRAGPCTSSPCGPTRSSSTRRSPPPLRLPARSEHPKRSRSTYTSRVPTARRPTPTSGRAAYASCWPTPRCPARSDASP